MDVSDLRRRILRALDEAKTEAVTRRSEMDAAKAAYSSFLEQVAVPLLRQAQSILKAERQMFTVHAPAGSAKLASDAWPQTFIEFTLDTSGGRAQVLGRVSLAHGGKRVVVEERPIAAGKPIAELRDDDVAGFLVTEIPKLVSRV